MLVIGAVGIAVLVHDEGRRRTAMIVLGAVLILGAVYFLKNPTLPRYFSLLLPAVAVLAGIAVGSVPRADPAPGLGRDGRRSHPRPRPSDPWKP